MAPRRRLDAELVRRGLAPSSEAARTIVLDGKVLVGGAVAQKPERLVAPNDPIVLQGPPPKYVGRGGLKLEAALERFEIEPLGLDAIDVGSSTGGFTDCLLQHGARSVVAIDVGRNQLHERLRADPRVSVHEQTNVRDVDPAAIGGPVPLVVADLSFVSLQTVFKSLLALVSPGGCLVVLVKPQFEASKTEVSRGKGVITDPVVWRRVLGELQDHVLSHRAAMMEVMVSPITGADGNVEFLTLIQRVADAPHRRPLDAAAFDRVVTHASTRSGARSGSTSNAIAHQNAGEVDQ